MKLQTIFLCLLVISSDVYAINRERISMYGYFDTEVEVTNANDASSLWTFDQHHLALIANYKIDDKFRVVTQTDWEHGPNHGEDMTAGEIYLAMSFLEYKKSDACRLRVGIFRTPFGIYNERHDATPTFIFTKLPTAVYGKFSDANGGERLFAMFSTGIQLLGSIFANEWEGQYRIGVSNGRGPQPSETDNNANKALIGRVIVSPPIEGFSLGSSYYAEKNGAYNDNRTSTVGFDLEVDRADFLFNAEMILLRYDNVENSVNSGTVHHGNSYYILGAYTFFDKLTPFFSYDNLNEDTEDAQDDLSIYRLGINYALAQNVFLKTEVHTHRPGNSNYENYEMFVASIAAAF